MSASYSIAIFEALSCLSMAVLCAFSAINHHRTIHSTIVEYLADLRLVTTRLLIIKLALVLSYLHNVSSTKNGFKVFVDGLYVCV